MSRLRLLDPPHRLPVGPCYECARDAYVLADDWNGRWWTALLSSATRSQARHALLEDVGPKPSPPAAFEEAHRLALDLLALRALTEIDVQARIRAVQRAGRDEDPPLDPLRDLDRVVHAVSRARGMGSLGLSAERDVNWGAAADLLATSIAGAAGTETLVPASETPAGFADACAAWSPPVLPVADSKMEAAVHAAAKAPPQSAELPGHVRSSSTAGIRSPRREADGSARVVASRSGTEADGLKIAPTAVAKVRLWSDPSRRVAQSLVTALGLRVRYARLLPRARASLAGAWLLAAELRRRGVHCSIRMPAGIEPARALRAASHSGVALVEARADAAAPTELEALLRAAGRARTRLWLELQLTDDASRDDAALDRVVLAGDILAGVRLGRPRCRPTHGARVAFEAARLELNVELPGQAAFALTDSPELALAYCRALPSAPTIRPSAAEHRPKARKPRPDDVVALAGDLVESPLSLRQAEEVGADWWMGEPEVRAPRSLDTTRRLLLFDRTLCRVVELQYDALVASMLERLRTPGRLRDIGLSETWVSRLVAMGVLRRAEGRAPHDTLP